MKEIGIDISSNKSKLIDMNYLKKCSIVVTLCGDARDKCPMTPSTVDKIHWPLQDPAQTQGDKNTKMIVFRDVRDQIRKNLMSLAE